MIDLGLKIPSKDPYCGRWDRKKSVWPPSYRAAKSQKFSPPYLPIVSFLNAGGGWWLNIRREERTLYRTAGGGKRALPIIFLLLTFTECAGSSRQFSLFGAYKNKFNDGIFLKIIRGCIIYASGACLQPDVILLQVVTLQLVMTPADCCFLGEFAIYLTVDWAVTP